MTEIPVITLDRLGNAQPLSLAQSVTAAVSMMLENDGKTSLYIRNRSAAQASTFTVKAFAGSVSGNVIDKTFVVAAGANQYVGKFDQTNFSPTGFLTITCDSANADCYMTGVRNKL